MIPAYPLKHTPICRRCNKECVRVSVLDSNKYGNSKRSYYTCKDFGHRKFSTFDDKEGIVPGNPPCQCKERWTSRRQINNQDQSEFYCCPVGGCGWTEDVNTTILTQSSVAYNAYQPRPFSSNLFGGSSPTPDTRGSVSRDTSASWTRESIPRVQVPSVGSQSSYPDVLRSSRPATVPSVAYGNNSDTVSSGAHFVPTAASRVPQYKTQINFETTSMESERGGGCCQCLVM
jgi:hypothetical protein